MDPAKIVIVGAGVSGLVAAQHLEAAGYAPLIIESTDRVGGRVKTDMVDGFACDHGFQVLLTAYQEAQRYLSYSKLDLKTFRPGAVVYRGGKSYPIVDPLREPAQLLTALFSPVASLKDKFLTWKLQRELKAVHPASLFLEDEQASTRQFLRAYGFSEAFIKAFFVPFFGGIFLENELKTPAAMLRFVFKMFAEGEAAVPNGGMEAIPKALRAELQKTQFRFQTQAEAILDNRIRTQNGEDIPFDALIVATNPAHLLPRLAGAATTHHATTTLYYRSKGQVLPARLIGLVESPEYMVNNFCELAPLESGYSPMGEQLVSVTLKDIPSSANAEEAVANELRQIAGHNGWSLTPIARYDIPKALPQLDHLTYDIQPTESRLTEQVFLAGDHLLFGSLDAAMRSGRRAAEGVLEALHRL